MNAPYSNLKWILFSVCSLCFSIARSQPDEVNKPVKNFDKLWEVFNDRYANFELKQVDWNAIYSEYRPMVNDSTTESELLDVCCSMVQELRDGHININPKFKDKRIRCGAPYNYFLDREFGGEGEQQAFADVIKKTLADNGFDPLTSLKYIKGSRIHYSTSEDFGYLRISSMSQGTTFGRLTRALNESLEACQDKKVLIVDLRFNGGGWDRISYNIAGRFTNTKQVGHYKKKRKKGTNDFNRLRKRMLRPKGKIRFTKPVIILTSDWTASAAEVFLMAMRELPNVTIVGTPSEGIFSNMYGFRLPNGWGVSLSHEQYFTSNMENFEGKGIPVDYPASNTREDLQKGEDSVLALALKIAGSNF